ncbi:hypothetical protein EXIGLDRAFT_712210 [Exidia glandulosa HHB12029]|uniref:DDE-1 domain-containing protein n=1 Tax=Exidia glandulosa HHB12029 TaxID=1314781 RepID=A0A165MK54_EXIGL|nr:hypothetical protein EXIGLDRAFT_712210 [Exidia glandulosa HHB12029]
MHVFGFSPRRPTRAAAKIPDNAMELGWRTQMRLCYLMHRYRIPAELVVNSDQTQCRYGFGTSRTWEETGAKQVTVHGKDEKRAFTIFAGITMSGSQLPFQAIYHGQTERSLPRPDAEGYDRAIELGFRFEPSKSDTYWSTQATMCSYVIDILAPYLERMRVELGLPITQRFIWLIDSWSVHRSEEFRDWMRANYPKIIVPYVPACCTAHRKCEDASGMNG